MDDATYRHILDAIETSYTIEDVYAVLERHRGDHGSDPCWADIAESASRQLEVIRRERELIDAAERGKQAYRAECAERATAWLRKRRERMAADGRELTSTEEAELAAEAVSGDMRS